MATTQIATIKRTSVIINIEWDKGSTFRHPFTWTTGPDLDNQTPVDLTGVTAAMHIRDKYDDSLLHTMTTENGGISLEPVAYSPNETGVIEVYISAADLAAFNWASTAVYDLDLFLVNGDVRKLVRGDFKLFDEVTT